MRSTTAFCCSSCLAATLAALTMVHPSPAEATVLVQMSIEQLATEADAVVSARVLAQRTAIDPQTRRVRTYTRVRVLRVVRSGFGTDRSGDELLIEQEGGVLNDIATFVSGNAHLSVGEHALLFLVRGDSHHHVLGMEQGKYTIYEDAAGAHRVRRPATVPVVSYSSTPPQIISRPSVPLNDQPLATMIAHILRAPTRAP